MAQERLARVRTAPIDDDGSFGRLSLLLPDGRRVPVTAPLVAGSSADADLRWSDPYMSGRHCVFEPYDEAVVLRDLSSRNGTFINGVRVERSALRPGSVVGIGSTHIRVALDQKLGAGMVGESTPMHKLRADIARFAGLPLPVLILGETGTGKELVARALHEQSGRRGVFVPVNCGSLPRELVESEMFGHERGAFTGADARRRGLFQEADGGTLFLDEVGELPPALQTRLLRALEGGLVRAVGATREAAVNVRVVAATNVDLDRAVREGAFRRDLLYRLNASVIKTPPLRARRADIPLLCERFLAEEAAHGRRARVSDEAMQALEQHGWPGNVRELRNVLHRAAALGGAVIGLEDLKLGDALLDGADDTVQISGRSYEQIESEIIARTVRRCGGNQRAASAELSIPRSTLNDKLRRYGIEVTATAARRRNEN